MAEKKRNGELTEEQFNMLVAIGELMKRKSHFRTGYLLSRVADEASDSLYDIDDDKLIESINRFGT